MDVKAESDSKMQPGEEIGKLSSFTSADRIRELLEIDAGVTQIVETAGLALKTLTTSGVSAEQLRTDFSKHANEYVLASQSVVARLRRQIYALEEAKVIAANRAAAEPQQSQPLAPARATSVGTGPNKSQPMQITNGGLGTLDVGRLNARIDKVGKQKEAELWGQARAHLENVTNSDDTAAKDDMDLDD